MTFLSMLVQLNQDFILFGAVGTNVSFIFAVLKPAVSFHRAALLELPVAERTSDVLYRRVGGEEMLLEFVLEGEALWTDTAGERSLFGRRVD